MEESRQGFFHLPSSIFHRLITHHSSLITFLSLFNPDKLSIYKKGATFYPKINNLCRFK